MKTTAKKGATKSAKAFTSKVAAKPTTKPPKNTAKPSAIKVSLQNEVQSALKWLKSHSTKATLDGMARYALPSDNAFGVAYRDMKVLGKRLGRNHELAGALWDTGVYEARMVASFVADPAQLTPAQMDRWCKAFDNWGICDTMCFNLFDRTPHAWAKVTHWSSSNDEFVKRTAFALLWSLSVHDKRTGDEPFIEGLTLIERAASDERNFVKKSANMALRAIGKRNRTLNAAAIAVARRLADSPNSVARWVGKDALRELTSPSVIRRLRPRAPNRG
ncbi:MAG: DNA alkylation repair enzyme [Acidobacteria bacterium]|nr:MAG: DNA alkylation repair enzyme [Acidobacteriota bacterium]